MITPGSCCSLKLPQPRTSNDPPWTFLIPIMFRGRRVSRESTASTTILEKNSFCWAIIFEFKAVPAHLIRRFRCSLGEDVEDQLTPSLYIKFPQYYNSPLVHIFTLKVLSQGIDTAGERGYPPSRRSPPSPF